MTSVFIRERGGDSDTEAETHTGKKMQEVPGAREGQEDGPLEPLDGAWLCWHLLGQHF